MSKSNPNEEKEPLTQRKTIESTIPNQYTENTIPEINDKELNNSMNNENIMNNKNNYYKNIDEQIPSSIYNDMASCSNYMNIIHEANVNLKLENERLKKEMLEKNRIISQFENISQEAQNKLHKLEDITNKRYDNLYKQMEQVGRIFNVPINCDFANNIQKALCVSNNESHNLQDKTYSLEQENYRLKSEIQNLNFENEKLNNYCANLEGKINNQSCTIKMKESDFNRKEQEYLNRICELKMCLNRKEDEINCFKNKLCNLQTQICKIQNNNCDYNNNRNMENIVYSQS